MLERHGISMDGKGSYNDNLFIERLWRTVKYEEVYPKACQDGREAKATLADYFRFYNNERPHQTLSYRTPAAVYNSNSLDNVPVSLISIEGSPKDSRTSTWSCPCSVTKRGVHLKDQLKAIAAGIMCGLRATPS